MQFFLEWLIDGYVTLPDRGMVPATVEAIKAGVSPELEKKAQAYQNAATNATKEQRLTLHDDNPSWVKTSDIALAFQMWTERNLSQRERMNVRSDSNMVGRKIFEMTDVQASRKHLGRGFAFPPRREMVKIVQGKKDVYRRAFEVAPGGWLE